eukprot:TRINITY_DN50438_c0_g1_i1.p1 TRINITY_DN50438_c0_g1~~TRINITY_DN50438_c0_g1_i1.p1  ORF type:complete len:231 (+),score=50.98 TRINITY_DN50438_c0_g1_i1:89-781(+)
MSWSVAAAHDGMLLRQWRWQQIPLQAILAVVTVALVGIDAVSASLHTPALDADKTTDGDAASLAYRECREELASCQRDQETKPNPPPWPPGFGNMLKPPFGLGMKELKVVARDLWQPDGTAADIDDEVTARGFRQFRSQRCVAEMKGIHPVGKVGERWSLALFESAQDWCIAQSNCTGIMLYVGKRSMHCHQWCGRPQFCSAPADTPEGREDNPDWSLFALPSRDIGTEL